MSASPLNVAPARAGALQLALRLTLGRPLTLVLFAVCAALCLATLLLGALAWSRLQPLQAPAWMHAQALVLASGAAGENDLSATGAGLRQVPLVVAAEFIGRDAALSQLAQRPGLAGLGLRELRPNPLPDAFVVDFAPGSSADAVEAAVAQLRRCKGVESVQYQPEPYRRAQALSAALRPVALLVGAALLAGALLGAALAARLRAPPDPQELRLLILLGAEPAVVCRPYAYAGGLAMLVAAALAWWLARAVLAQLDAPLAQLAHDYALHWSDQALTPAGGALFCGALALLGALLAALRARSALAAALRDSEY